MEKTLFILGAGFSKPLGLPVIADFLQLSKDMFQNDPVRYAKFNEIFQHIRQMGMAQSYVNVDLDNIEEILSVLEMDALTKNEEVLVEKFKAYIGEVIRDSTPPISITCPPRRNVGFAGDNQEPVRYYIGNQHEDDPAVYLAFVASLFNVSLMWAKPESGNAETPVLPTWRTYNQTSCYGIISLNYDMVLEMSVDAINAKLSQSPNKAEIGFSHSIPKTIDELYKPNHVHLAKLHGSVHDNSIIPPTWNKYQSTAVKNAWSLARRLIAGANHIVFLGYVHDLPYLSPFQNRTNTTTSTLLIRSIKLVQF